MYCSKCGKEFKEEAQFCPYCGQNIAMPSSFCEGYKEEKYNVCAIVGFVLSLVSLFISIYGIVNIVAVIVSAIGLKQIKETNESGSGLAIAGIIIGAISVAITLVVLVIFGSLISLFSWFG